MSSSGKVSARKGSADAPPRGQQAPCISAPLYAASVELYDDGHIVFDPDGLVTFANDLAFTMLRRHIHIEPLTVAALDFPPLYDLFHAALADPAQVHTCRVDLPYTGESGDIRARAAIDSSGKIKGVVAALHDLRYEENLDRMKADFLSTVSHELRTPLTSILGYSSLLYEAGDSIAEEDRRQFLRTIETQGRVLLDLINDLIVISKLESDSMQMQIEPYEVSKLLTSVFGEYSSRAAGSGIMLSVDPESGPLLAMCDPTRIQQALGYLLDNALRFTPAGGDVTLRCYISGENIVLEVSDTGIGIPPKNQEHLFEKFYQVDNSASRKANGTGLGLAIVKGIVEHHDGEVFVESEEGHGSTFGFTLPICKQASGSLSEASEEAA